MLGHGSNSCDSPLTSAGSEQRPWQPVQPQPLPPTPAARIWGHPRGWGADQQLPQYPRRSQRKLRRASWKLGRLLTSHILGSMAGTNTMSGGQLCGCLMCS